MKTHRVLASVFAGICLSLSGAATLAGNIDCQSVSDPACEPSVQQYNGYTIEKFQFGNMLSDYGAFSPLANGTPQFHQLNWGHVLNHARVLHLFLFDQPLAVELPNEGANGIGDGYQYPVANIDEPGTIALLCLGLAAIGINHLRRKTRPPH
ncbi:PEP-CTERM sorting domain-containing protein [Marinobacter mobilis]|uniref:PEP-CTERM protein-sorting domain-containing protein n=1 Tax=Marinobacter mobilis TaxID=488533 RepID=A0A1H2XGU5_9GAMM|nr:PEP-CTERM sorting domain-containing protein [Marinobacter mobilis]SDW92041.1 PEP-CTERM protein-sorting domain-containing protein [Marinobacter mobilis]